MTRNVKLLSSLAAILALVAACDGGNGVAGNPQAKFGNLFAAAFNANSAADPADDPNLVIVYNGVNGVDYTADPLDI